MHIYLYMCKYYRRVVSARVLSSTAESRVTVGLPPATRSIASLLHTRLPRRIRMFSACVCVSCVCVCRVCVCVCVSIVRVCVYICLHQVLDVV